MTTDDRCFPERCTLVVVIAFPTFLTAYMVFRLLGRGNLVVVVIPWLLYKKMGVAVM